MICVLQFLSKDIRDQKAKVQGLLEEKESLTNEHQDLTKQRAKLELIIKDLQEEEDGDKSNKVNETIGQSYLVPDG